MRGKSSLLIPMPLSWTDKMACSPSCRTESQTCPFIGVLGRIAQQIGDDLGQSHGVGFHENRGGCRRSRCPPRSEHAISAWANWSIC